MNSYTLYCVLLVSFNQVFSAPKVIYDQQTSNCAIKLNIDKYILYNHAAENFRLAKGLKDEPRFIHCIMEAHGVIEGDGEIVMENMYKGIANVFLPMIGKKGDTNAIAIKICDKCAKTTGDDLDDRIINLHNCLVDAAKKY
ncbi:hypothetical protein FQR65_LT07255 [Abscondita terminalis]|nr:hypothetical protein FQR65_LT07255 [Abscondita terminalis]